MNELSEKETKLLDFIKTSIERITVKTIEEKLGKEYTGALGKLISKDLIEKKKDRTNADSYAGKKLIKYYVVKKIQSIPFDGIEDNVNLNNKEE